MRETFLPSQIFVFSGFALRANLIGHLEQIDSYAPGHQISFGNLDYVADIRGGLIFQWFAPPTSALALHPEHVAKSEDGLPEPAGLSAATKPITGKPDEITSLIGPESRQEPSFTMKPDSPPDTSSKLSRSVLCEFGQGASTPPNPPYPRSPVHTSLLNEALDLMRSLAIA